MAYEMRSGMVNSILRKGPQAPRAGRAVEEGCWGDAVKEAVDEIEASASRDDISAPAQPDSSASAHDDSHAPTQLDSGAAAQDGNRPPRARGGALPSIQTTILLDGEGYAWLRSERLRRKVERGSRQGSSTAIIGEALGAVADLAAGGVALEEIGSPCDGTTRRVTVSIAGDVWSGLFELAEERRMAGAPSAALSMSALARGGLMLLRSPRGGGGR